VNTKHIGVLTVLLASIMWAIEPIMVKLSYVNSDFLHTSALRALVAALTAGLYLLLTKKSPLRINKKQGFSLLYLAVVGTLIADFLYIFALSQIPVINAVILGICKHCSSSSLGSFS
jgi:drug/metabolite transporter (DMT)-like permease